MGYKVYAPNRVNGLSTWIDLVEGSPADTPGGSDNYCHYLLDYALTDQYGDTVPCDVEMSYCNGSVPAHIGTDGKPWVGYLPAYLNLTLPEAIGTGSDCTFDFTMACVPGGQPLESGGSQTISAPILVAQKPQASSARPAIPGVSAWREHMVEIAEKWKQQLLDPSNALGDDNWYYDIASTYWQIGDYLCRSNHYSDVAMTSIGRYRDYLTAAGGVPAGWCAFPRGLRQTYERTQDGAWIDLIKGMTAGGWISYGGSPDPSLMRETAYSSDVWRELVYVDASNDAMLEKSVDFLLVQLNLLYGQEVGRDEGMVNEPFFFGLAAQSLIDYFDLTSDERIPESLMGATRYIWDHGVNEKTGYVKYDLWTPVTDWHTGLNPLMYNAWGFLFKTTGNDLYRQQGDVLFEHQFDDQAYAWSPKQFAQMYRRSIDYVTRWRA